ncbi:hypothetical protein BDN70DRAFT_821637 [Pholiota conissans]|uniref:Uncharacterized protein n=1 Tax=Pholiota conissans TaxID=109636 RepID=A0A9P5YKB6_9AGAR|nr:hypothetical protein BDN70DRAFT_821637 [Pholiota conissans]
MVNSKGVNGSGIKNYPPDEEFKETLLKYSRQGLKQSEKLARLILDHGLDISLAKLNQFERKFEIPSVRRKKLEPEEIVQVVLDEVQKDVTQNNGPNYFKERLKDRDIKVPRDTIRSIMREYYPEGAAKWYPGKKKLRVNRQPLSALGPFHEIAADGHEKLGALALQMGGLSLPIYAYRDKWSGDLVQATTVPDCRSPGTCGHLYLDLIEKLGGISQQLNLDKGSEIGWEVAFQKCLRCVIYFILIQVITSDEFAPQIDEGIYPSVALLKSVHNIVIESLWQWLRAKIGYNLREIIISKLWRKQ